MSHLATMLRERQAGRSLRKLADEIGVSPATLSRVARGAQPDLNTYNAIQCWLKKDEPSDARPTYTPEPITWNTPTSRALIRAIFDRAVKSRFRDHSPLVEPGPTLVKANREYNRACQEVERLLMELWEEIDQELQIPAVAKMYGFNSE